MPITIEQIKKLNAERTQGEWIISKGDYDNEGPKFFVDSMHRGYKEEEFEANRAFIAAAPSIAELAIRQAKEIEELQKGFAYFSSLHTKMTYEEALGEIKKSEFPQPIQQKE